MVLARTDLFGLQRSRIEKILSCLWTLLRQLKQRQSSPMKWTKRMRKSTWNLYLLEKNSSMNFTSLPERFKVNSLRRNVMVAILCRRGFRCALLLVLLREFTRKERSEWLLQLDKAKRWCISWLQCCFTESFRNSIQGFCVSRFQTPWRRNLMESFSTIPLILHTNLCARRTLMSTKIIVWSSSMKLIVTFACSALRSEKLMVRGSFKVFIASEILLCCFAVPRLVDWSSKLWRECSRSRKRTVSPSIAPKSTMLG